MRKPVFGVSDQVRHKPGGAATEDSLMLEIWDTQGRGIQGSFSGAIFAHFYTQNRMKII